MKQIWIPRAGEPEVLELREAEAQHYIQDRKNLGEVLLIP